MADMDFELLEYIVHHVILPPKLPAGAEHSQLSRKAERHLVKILLTQLESYCLTIDPASSDLCEAWAINQTMLDRCNSLISTPSLDSETIQLAFASMEQSGEWHDTKLHRFLLNRPTDKPSVLPLYLRAQNAVLILRKEVESVVFECFEASPSAEAVMASRGALTRRFPAHAVSIPLEVFNDQNFKYELAEKICRLDVEQVEEMIPRDPSASSTGVEFRDTANPKLVTEMLMAILASLGTPKKVHQIQKRTRDDVLCDSGLLPWRRSPFWLALRVTIQSTLAALLPQMKATTEYKNFMILILTDIVSQASAVELPDQVCHITLTKIARRVSKLGSDTQDYVRDRALMVCGALDAEHRRKWGLVCDEDGERPTTIDQGAFERDTALSLVASRDYINAILENDRDVLAKTSSFVPECRPWLGFDGGLPVLDLPAVDEQETVYILAAFESWVSDSLPHWTQQSLKKPNAKVCMALVEVAISYRDIAQPIYCGAPEQLSCMFLVMAEIWHALDQLTVSLLPLLKEFVPSIPRDFFYPLLLPKATQMRRLQEIELHIDARHNQAKHTNPPIFSDPKDDCFAVQFFASSTRHKTLKKRIDLGASAQQAHKKKEWKESSDKYDRLKTKANSLSCQTTQQESGDATHDSEKCEKCTLSQEADSISIEVHEWPLPHDACVWKSVVFEMNCPPEFVAWRNLTWVLVQDFGRQSLIGGGNPEARLCSYSGLQKYFRDKKSRLTLASSTKAFAQANPHPLKFPVSIENCFVRSTLQYKLFDSLQGCWIQNQVEVPSLHKKCITLLPEGPYSDMQYAVDSVDHSDNQVIADQGSSSTVLRPGEYLSFGSLRADGERIQWYNIKREMAASNLSFNTESVCTLITQAVWQAGSNGTSELRNAHLVLRDAPFCIELLATIGKVLKSISANWKSDDAMLLLITIVLRVTSLSSDPSIIDKALDLLRNMRSVSRDWVSILTSINYVEPEQNSKLQQRLLKTAILCKMTFNVDTPYLTRVMSTADDLKTWVECSIYVRNNSPGEAKRLPRDLDRLRLHDMKSSHALQFTIRQLSLDDIRRGLDLAIAQQWSYFRPGLQSWNAFDSPNDRWLVTETAKADRQPLREVCYNLLEGELLVDGKLLGRLPAEYLRSDVYISIFGAQIIRVFPSDMPSMLYMSNGENNGYVTHFGMHGEQVVIRTVKGLQTLELIPHHELVGDLPAALVTDYVHWLDPANREIEFRPIGQPWQSDVDNWRLRYNPNDSSYLLVKDKKIIDIRSKTCEKILSIFGGLEVIDHVHITLSNDQRLEVALPRFDLRFFLNHDGEFQCYELNKIVDPDQSVGTLIGLKSRLVLSGIQPLARKHDRIILIPEGQVEVVSNDLHVEATITVRGSEIRLLRYQIDATLGRLQGDGDMFSTVYKAYLHAVTTHMLPDRLTGFTGTEEAISLLSQRCLGLIKPPDPRTIEALTKIAALTPRREFYPNHMKVMQQVGWHKTLPILTQHDKFLTLAEHIITSGDSYLVFYPETRSAESLCKRRNPHLLERAKIRNSCFRSLQFGGDIDSRGCDHTYKSRDCPAETIRGSRSFMIASLIRDWPEGLEVSRDLKKDLTSYGKVSELATTFDAAGPLSELLEVKFFSSWAPLMNFCRTSSQDDDTYQLLFLFATIAYGKRIKSLNTLRTILAFAFIPKLRKISLPAGITCFEFRRGLVVDEQTLEEVIHHHTRKYKGYGKQINRPHWDAQKEKYDAESKEQAKNIIDVYRLQWPCRKPKTPSLSLSSRLNWEAVSREISEHFLIWFANHRYSKFISAAQKVLDGVYLQSPFYEYTVKDWHLVQEPQFVNETGTLPSLSVLMSAVIPASLSKTDILKVMRTQKPTHNNEKLRALIAAIRSDGGENHHHSDRRQYREDLLASYNAFCNYEEQVNPTRLPLELTDTVFNRLTCESEVSGILKLAEDVLGANDPVSRLLDFAGLWPRLTLRSLLVNLSTTSTNSITTPWTTFLLKLGESVTLVQRARRLVLAGERNDIATFCIEIENEGHQGWDSSDWPDWLLMEIEGDFLIRPTQARVALEMIQPSSSANSLVQLNMGQ